MGRFYGAIDLHSNNNYAVISNERDEVIRKKRLVNDLGAVDQFFSAHKAQLSEIVIESTYNGYWLMDGLQALGYGVKLANPSAMQPYVGLKHGDDESDALWLNQMHRLGILPEGYIYPKSMRAVRDLLRRRMLLVRSRTGLINSLKHHYQSWKAMDIGASEIKRLSEAEITEAFGDTPLQYSAQILRASIRSLTEQIERAEKWVAGDLKTDTIVERLRMLPGIGKLLGWMIRLEIGELARFEAVENYLSYCGLVESRRISNEKPKGRGNAKNRNKYLRWAYGEAAILNLRNPRIKKYHDRLVKKKGAIKAKAIIASKLARVSFMLMKNPALVYDETRLFN